MFTNGHVIFSSQMFSVYKINLLPLSVYKISLVPLSVYKISLAGTVVIVLHVMLLQRTTEFHLAILLQKMESVVVLMSLLTNGKRKGQINVLRALSHSIQSHGSMLITS